MSDPQTKEGTANEEVKSEAPRPRGAQASSSKGAPRTGEGRESSETSNTAAQPGEKERGRSGSGEVSGERTSKQGKGQQDASAGAAEGASNVGAQMRERMTSAEEMMRETVKQRPLTLVGAALGVGLCLGFTAGCLLGVFALRPKRLDLRRAMKLVHR
jgi:hypothetical protein